MDTETELTIMALERELALMLHPILASHLKVFAASHGLPACVATPLLARFMIAEGASALCYGHSQGMDPELLSKRLMGVVREYFGVEKMSVDRN